MRVEIDTLAPCAEDNHMSETNKKCLPASLTDLVDFLESLRERAPIEKLGELLESCTATPEDLAPFVRFGDVSYRRNLICESDWYELLCICWKSGQRSPIHDHAHSTCGLKIIQGVATETLFEQTAAGQIKAVKSTDCGVGHVCSTQDADVHQVSNLQKPGEDLMTLHIYSPPLKSMQTYSLLGAATELYTPKNFMVCQFADGI